MPRRRPARAPHGGSDNVVSGLVIRRSHEAVLLQTVGCGMEKPPCPTHNRWKNTTITGNTIEPQGAGIHVTLSSSMGDRVGGLTVTGNTIRQNTRFPSEAGAAIQVDAALIATQSLISDVLIARNSIDAVQVGGDGGIVIGSGLQRAQANTIENVRILNNRIHVVWRRVGQPCCEGIFVGAGFDTWAVDIRPVNYPDGNVVRNVQIVGTPSAAPSPLACASWLGAAAGPATASTTSASSAT